MSGKFVVITGSAGLIGSECVRLFAGEGYRVVGIDNDMRSAFFGPQASTAAVVDELRGAVPGYTHWPLDIRDRTAVRDLFEKYQPAAIIHTAAQPSHDKAAQIPYLDFDVNAIGTLNLLVAARDFCPDSPFCFTSTNKVYGDHPNAIPMQELETRFDYLGIDSIDETMSIDQCLHSLFGASKVAADVLCQEFGRYFGMPVGVFRGGCLTGPGHAAVEMHGFLNYIVKCAVHRRPFTIFGHKGKQVRDQIHAADVASLFLEFTRNPRVGEVYNIGGGRENSVSILETISILSDIGFPVDYQYSDQSRIGDHICYISDLRKARSHFPRWSIRYGVRSIIEEIVRHELKERVFVPAQLAQHALASRNAA